MGWSKCSTCGNLYATIFCQILNIIFQKFRTLMRINQEVGLQKSGFGCFLNGLVLAFEVFMI